MPVQRGTNKEGCFYRWGDQGKKYYYECGNDNQRKEAKKKAIEQGIAIGEYKFKFKHMEDNYKPESIFNSAQPNDWLGYDRKSIEQDWEEDANSFIKSKLERLTRYMRRDNISIDYRGIMTNKAIIDILNKLQPYSIRELFIITTRKDTGVTRLANKLEIPRRNIIRVDSDDQKYDQINSNNIDYHIDNDGDFVRRLGSRGIEI